MICIIKYYYHEVINTYYKTSCHSYTANILHVSHMSMDYDIRLVVVCCIVIFRLDRKY